MKCADCNRCKIVKNCYEDTYTCKRPIRCSIGMVMAEIVVNPEDECHYEGGSLMDGKENKAARRTVKGVQKSNATSKQKAGTSGEAC